LLNIPEYDLEKPNSLFVLTEDDVISAGKVKQFRKELERIAGKNPHGEPILAMRWGPTYEDPMSTRPTIKYQDFVDSHGKEFGERRWIIERWRSPEFLARSGRYQIVTRQDPETGEKLLKTIQANGCYDYWLRLERANFTYHPPDGEALNIICGLWKWEQTPQNERDALEQANRELERRQMILAQRQQTGNAPQFGSGLIAPAYQPR
jgi:hypothetical protein